MRRSFAPAILAKLPDFALEIYMRVRPTGGSMSTAGEKLRYVELVTERAMQAAIEALCLVLRSTACREAAVAMAAGIASGQVSELEVPVSERGEAAMSAAAELTPEDRARLEMMLRNLKRAVERFYWQLAFPDRLSPPSSLPA